MERGRETEGERKRRRGEGGGVRGREGEIRIRTRKLLCIGLIKMHTKPYLIYDVTYNI